MENTARIQRISGRLYAALFVFTVLLPILTVGYWVFLNHLPESLVAASMKMQAGLPKPSEVTLVQRMLGLAVSLVPLAIKMAAMLTLMRLLKLYRAGIVFSGDHVACFKRLGRILVYYTFAGVAESTGIVLVMTMNNPPGQKMLTIGFSSNEITLLVVAAIVLMISWIMDEGRKLAEEQSLTI